LLVHHLQQLVHPDGQRDTSASTYLAFLTIHSGQTGRRRYVWRSLVGLSSRGRASASAASCSVTARREATMLGAAGSWSSEQHSNGRPLSADTSCTLSMRPAGCNRWRSPRLPSTALTPFRPYTPPGRSAA
jgi:hypothetical protein